MVEALAESHPGTYTMANLLLSATHTHSGPAGYMQYFLFNFPNLGWTKQTLDAQVANKVKYSGLHHLSIQERPVKNTLCNVAQVEGITESIKRAHNSLAAGRWEW